MRIATWNINSVRLRLDLIGRLIDQEAPDVLCLQETKVEDASFPFRFFEERGYVHRHINGMKAYNGVAILSRIPFLSVGARDWQDKADCRHAFVTLQNGVHLHNFYVPAGGDVPDPVANPKFAHKLGFVDEMTAWLKARDQKDKTVLVGDLNIAPMEHDVWSHTQMLDVVSHTPAEVSRLEAAQQAGGFIDAARHFVPPDQKLYSWWSYRARDWELSNRGRRLDHIWVTPDLVSSLARMSFLRDARGWLPKPSDHVPVLVDVI